MRKDSPLDAARIRHVLTGVNFPAAKWQLIIHAEDYGADSATRTDLWGLPAGTYENVSAVVAALGLGPAPPRGGHRPSPPARAAVQERPSS